MDSIIALDYIPKLHTTPLATVICNSPSVVVELDDVNTKRIKLVFEPYQALRMVTADCYRTIGGNAIIPQTVMEIQDSFWISELREELKLTDYEATFMDKARHFLLPLQDDFLEIVSWGVKLETEN